jgi:hypothetical protein
VAAFAALKLHLVITLGPDAKRERSARQFVEGLAQELRTRLAHVDPNAATTGLLNGRNAAVGRHRLAGFKPIALRSPCCRHPPQFSTAVYTLTQLGVAAVKILLPATGIAEHNAP